MKKIIKTIGTALHHWHERVYTAWKVHETGVQFSEGLTYAEQEFFLKYRQALSGKDLVVYDVGAANGVLSRGLVKLKNVRAVYAFEPIPSAFEELSKNTHGCTNIEKYNIALGDEDNEATIWVALDSRDSSSLLKMKTLHKDELPYASYDSYPETIQVARLDEFAAQKNIPPPNVIKIDVQGYEDRVIWGGANTISHADFVILEMSFTPLYDNSPLFDDIYKQMRDLNFQLVGVGGQLHGVSGLSLQVDGIFYNQRVLSSNA